MGRKGGRKGESNGQLYGAPDQPVLPWADMSNSTKLSNDLSVFNQLDK